MDASEKKSLRTTQRNSKRNMYFRMLFRSLSKRRTRVLIGLLAVAIGATSLTGLTSIFFDLPRQLGQEFRSYGANMVVLPERDASLKISDIDQLANVTKSMTVIGQASYRYENIKINEQPFTAVGTDIADVQRVRPYWEVVGRWPIAAEVLVGKDAAELIGLTPEDDLKLVATAADSSAIAVDVRVSGILNSGGAEDAFVIAPRGLLAQLFGDAERIDVVEFSIAADTATLEKVAVQLHDAVPTISATPVKRLVRSEASVLATITSLLLLVSVVVLALTLISVATTTLAVITERFGEVALRKALGASNRSLVNEFLGESLILGALGGLIGAFAGLAFAHFVCFSVFGRGVDAPWLIVPVTVLISMVVTGVASLIPVRQTAGVNPAIVLQGE